VLPNACDARRFACAMLALPNEPHDWAELARLLARARHRCADLIASTNSPASCISQADSSVQGASPELLELCLEKTCCATEVISAIAEPSFSAALEQSLPRWL